MSAADDPGPPVPIAEQVARANESGRVPVVFIHGLWLLPSSWDRWATLFADAGHAPVSPGWPDDPDTVAEAYAAPGVFADKTIGAVADRYSQVIGTLTRKPAVIGHSFGGLLAQIAAGRGESAATVAIDAAPFRGVLPLQPGRAGPGPLARLGEPEPGPGRGPGHRRHPAGGDQRRHRLPGQRGHLRRRRTGATSSPPPLSG
jgi:pimeloyl-ACP methyl ester carboxylesterase